MADPTAFYEPEEDELLSSLAVPQYGTEGYDEESYRRLQELEQHAYAQQIAAAEQEQAAALEQVPEDVKRVRKHGSDASLNANHTRRIADLLFSSLCFSTRLSSRTTCLRSPTCTRAAGTSSPRWVNVSDVADEQAHYQQSEWPEAELIAPLVQNDQVFLTLYRELYFRHVYARLQPTIDDRFQSYENICELFNYLLNSDGPVPLDLPIQWLWDMLDEFVYQFQSFAQWRASPKNKTEEELDMLAEASQIWSCYSVLNVLYSLMQKSQINEQLRAEKAGKSPEEVAEIAGEYGSKPLYRNLGYFSLICLLRVHVLLGDPTLALQIMENVELTGDAFLTRITACHVTTYYHVGCAYMALGRWPDAIKTFISVLIFFIRMKQYHTRSYQYHTITKQCERMYALLAICTTLSPGPTDDSIMTIVKEHYGDQLATLQRGGDEALEVFKELFLQACPKYLSVNPPPYEDPDALQAWMANPPPDASQRYLDLFLSDVVAVRGVSNVRNLLKLYTSIDAAKLATFLSEGDEEDVLQQLMVLKAASRSYRYEKGEGSTSLLDGHRFVTNALDFTIDNTMVHVEETTTHRRFAGFFIRNAEHAQRAFNTIRAAPLPTQRKKQEKKEQQEGKTEQPQRKAAWVPKSRQVRAAA